MAMFSYLSDADFGKEELKFLTGAKIVHEIYQRFSKSDRILEALRVRVFFFIAKFIYVKYLYIMQYVRLGLLSCHFLGDSSSLFS